MSSSFFALELNSGEAFLLKTCHNNRDFTILVDSGKSNGDGKQHPLVEAINKAMPSLTLIDVAVCTHQDSDHANGFSDFADYWCRSGRTIQEYWLPGRWSAALPTILTEPGRFLEKLGVGVMDSSLLSQCVSARSFDACQTDGEFNEISKLLVSSRMKSHIVNAFSDTIDQSYAREDHRGLVSLEATALEQDRRLCHSLGLSNEELLVIRTRYGFAGIDDRSLSSFSSYLSSTDEKRESSLEYDLMRAAKKTADSIYKISISAISHKIRVRWFDFGLFEKSKKPSGGIAGLLEPLNAVECFSPPKRVSPVTLLACLTLSETNVESLVFLRPESDTEPAVLFLADSWLSFDHSGPSLSNDFPKLSSRPQRPFIATAPHHGSRTNDNAYKWIQTWLDGSTQTFYVRNGGEPKQKLGLFKTQQDKACAQCLQCNGKAWTQLVSVETLGNDWQWPPASGQIC